MESSPKSFPRGGAAILSELETRNIQEEIEIDFKAPAYERLENVEKLTFKKLAVGMTLLCTVKQVNDLDLVLSLPNLLTGYASITDLNSYLTSVLTDDDVPDLATLFHVGQIIPCCITNLIDAREKGAHRKIELSINPAVVNASARTSDISSGMVFVF